MANSWRALPIPNNERYSLKAPSMADYRKQEARGQSFRPVKEVGEEVLVAATMADALEDAELRIPMGREFRIWRYAQGIAVGLPSGWTLYVPMEGMKSGKEWGSPTPPTSEP